MLNISRFMKTKYMNTICGKYLNLQQFLLVRNDSASWHSRNRLCLLYILGRIWNKIRIMLVRQSSSYLTLNTLNCFKVPEMTKFIMDQPYMLPILSMPFLLMPWRLTSPGYQQAWYWPNILSNIRRVLSRYLKALIHVHAYCDQDKMVDILQTTFSSP